ncbi:MAG: putative formate transporter 1 [bacterium]|nr:putative formate transporter 1 [bacterium]
MSTALYGLEVYTPAEIAQRVRDVGVKKARLPVLTTLGLGVLAGGFIGLGALGFLVITSDPALGFSVGRLLGGLLFCCGLILVILAGAELFTGNNLLILAWTSQLITTPELLRNWLLVLLGNLLGAVGLALLVTFAQTGMLADGAVGEQMVRVASSKAALPWDVAFYRGVGCNILVCLAVWMALGGHTVTDKVVAILWPITLFVVVGFEHSVANFFFLPLGYWHDTAVGNFQMPAIGQTLLSQSGVIAGNVVGGGLLVGLVYWWIYLRQDSSSVTHPVEPGDES